MARVALTVQTAAGPYPANAVTAATFAFTFATMDATSGNSFVHTGREMLLVRNAHSAAHNVTLTSRAIGALGNRAQDVIVSVAAAAFFAYEATRLPGWNQSDGSFYLSASNSALQVAVLRFEP